MELPEVRDNQLGENLSGVAIRRGQRLTDEYGNQSGRYVKQGDATTRLSPRQEV